MKIAVTGSEGLIGGLLVQKLARAGHEVVACTRKSCNVLNAESVKKAFRGADAVVHCAAQLDEDAADLFDVNVRGTENVLEACAANAVSHMIFLSTVGVYGLLPGTKDERTEPKPETLYERSKLDAEKKVLSYQEVFHVTILRPALVLGKNKYWKKIVQTIAKGFPLIGSGENLWQMVCPDDVASAVVFCLGREECYEEIFIVAEKEPRRLVEVVGLIKKALGMHGSVSTLPAFLGGPIAAVNSVLKFNSLLTPAYLKRMGAERSYSTAKLEALGWKAECDTVKEISAIAKWATEGKK